MWEHDGEEDLEDTTVSSIFRAVDKDDDVRRERGHTGAGSREKHKKGKKAKGKKKSKRKSTSSTDSSSSPLSSSDSEDSSEVDASKCYLHSAHTTYIYIYRCDLPGSNFNIILGCY